MVIGVAMTGLPFAGAERAFAQAPAAPAAGPIMEPEDLQLVTKDRVVIVATYYPVQKKDAVPVVLVHGFKGNRHEYDEMAKFLQGKGHAVVTVDLRGHGDSRSVEGSDQKLEADRLTAAQMQAMTEDLEAVKKFLMARNNEGKLNIQKLCVIGAEMGAVLALRWAAIDWSWPPLGAYQQGHDVRAVVLLSPTYTFKSLRATEALAHDFVKKDLSVYIAVGSEDSKAVREAERIYESLERFRPKPEKVEDRTLFFDSKLQTKLQGTGLLTEASLELQQRIALFIDLRLVRQTIPWKDRTNPLTGM